MNDLQVYSIMGMGTGHYRPEFNIEMIFVTLMFFLQFLIFKFFFNKINEDKEQPLECLRNKYNLNIAVIIQTLLIGFTYVCAYEVNIITVIFGAILGLIFATLPLLVISAVKQKSISKSMTFVSIVSVLFSILSIFPEFTEEILDISFASFLIPIVQLFLIFITINEKKFCKDKPLINITIYSSIFCIINLITPLIAIF